MTWGGRRLQTTGQDREMNQTGTTDERSCLLGGRRRAAAEKVAQGTCLAHLGVIVDGALKACLFDCLHVPTGGSSELSTMDLTICSSTKPKTAPASGRPVPTHRHIHRGTDGRQASIRLSKPVCGTDMVCVICILPHCLVMLRQRVCFT